MPKNRNGCYLCGRPSTRTLQLWLRRIDANARYANGCPLQASIDSVARSLCQACADNQMLDLYEMLERQAPGVHGCTVCAEKCIARLQVWLRESHGRKKHVASLSRGYCATHMMPTYRRIGEPLGVDDPRTHSGGGSPTGLDAARAHMRRNREAQ